MAASRNATRAVCILVGLVSWLACGVEANERTDEPNPFVAAAGSATSLYVGTGCDRDFMVPLTGHLLLQDVGGPYMQPYASPKQVAQAALDSLWVDGSLLDVPQGMGSLQLVFDGATCFRTQPRDRVMLALRLHASLSVSGLCAGMMGEVESAATPLPPSQRLGTAQTQGAVGVVELNHVWWNTDEAVQVVQCDSALAPLYGSAGGGAGLKAVLATAQLHADVCSFLPSVNTRMFVPAEICATHNCSAVLVNAEAGTELFSACGLLHSHELTTDYIGNASRVIPASFLVPPENITDATPIPLHFSFEGLAGFQLMAFYSSSSVFSVLAAPAFETQPILAYRLPPSASFGRYTDRERFRFLHGLLATQRIRQAALWMDDDSVLMLQRVAVLQHANGSVTPELEHLPPAVARGVQPTGAALNTSGVRMAVMGTAPSPLYPSTCTTLRLDATALETTCAWRGVARLEPDQDGVHVLGCRSPWNSTCFGVCNVCDNPAYLETQTPGWKDGMAAYHPSYLPSVADCTPTLQQYCRVVTSAMRPPEHMPVMWGSPSPGKPGSRCSFGPNTLDTVLRCDCPYPSRYVFTGTDVLCVLPDCGAHGTFAPLASVPARNVTTATPVCACHRWSVETQEHRCVCDPNAALLTGSGDCVPLEDACAAVPPEGLNRTASLAHGAACVFKDSWTTCVVPASHNASHSAPWLHASLEPCLVLTAQEMQERCQGAGATNTARVHVVDNDTSICHCEPFATYEIADVLTSPCSVCSSGSSNYVMIQDAWAEPGATTPWRQDAQRAWCYTRAHACTSLAIQHHPDMELLQLAMEVHLLTGPERAAIPAPDASLLRQRLLPVASLTLEERLFFTLEQLLGLLQLQVVGCACERVHGASPHTRATTRSATGNFDCLVCEGAGRPIQINAGTGGTPLSVCLAQAWTGAPVRIPGLALAFADPLPFWWMRLHTGDSSDVEPSMYWQAPCATNTYALEPSLRCVSKEELQRSSRPRSTPALFAASTNATLLGGCNLLNRAVMTHGHTCGPACAETMVVDTLLGVDQVYRWRWSPEEQRCRGCGACENGACSPGPEFECECEIGWEGEDCSLCPAGRGETEAGDCEPCADLCAPFEVHRCPHARCDCAALHRFDQIGGCGACIDGFGRAEGGTDTSPCAPCAGTCSAKNLTCTRTNSRECVCPPGYRGLDCSDCDQGFIAHGSLCLQCSEACGERGCVVKHDQAVCDCSELHRRGTAHSCGDCEEGWYGATCTKRCACAVVLPTGQRIKNSNKGCIASGSCVCREGWTGPACDQCATNYVRVETEDGVVECSACPTAAWLLANCCMTEGQSACRRCAALHTNTGVVAVGCDCAAVNREAVLVSPTAATAATAATSVNMRIQRMLCDEAHCSPPFVLVNGTCNTHEEAFLDLFQQRQVEVCGGRTTADRTMTRPVLRNMIHSITWVGVDLTHLLSTQHLPCPAGSASVPITRDDMVQEAHKLEASRKQAVEDMKDTLQLEMGLPSLGEYELSDVFDDVFHILSSSQHWHIIMNVGAQPFLVAIVVVVVTLLLLRGCRRMRSLLCTKKKQKKTVRVASQQQSPPTTHEPS